jgi:hypothetical protein
MVRSSSPAIGCSTPRLPLRRATHSLDRSRPPPSCSNLLSMLLQRFSLKHWPDLCELPDQRPAELVRKLAALDLR